MKFSLQYSFVTVSKVYNKTIIAMKTLNKVS